MAFRLALAAPSHDLLTRSEATTAARRGCPDALPTPARRSSGRVGILAGILAAVLAAGGGCSMTYIPLDRDVCGCESCEASPDDAGDDAGPDGLAFDVPNDDGEDVDTLDADALPDAEADAGAADALDLDDDG